MQSRVALKGRTLCSDGAGVGVVVLLHGGTFPLARSALLIAGVGGYRCLQLVRRLGAAAPTTPMSAQQG